jgi:hypothetical protein
MLKKFRACPRLTSFKKKNRRNLDMSGKFRQNLDKFKTPHNIDKFRKKLDKFRTRGSPMEVIKLNRILDLLMTLDATYCQCNVQLIYGLAEIS